MESEQDSSPVFALSPNYNPTIIHVKSAPKTRCHFNPNSRYQLSSPPQAIVDSLNSPSSPEDSSRDEDGFENDEQEVINWYNDSKSSDVSCLETPKQGILPAQVICYSEKQFHLKQSEW